MRDPADADALRERFAPTARAGPPVTRSRRVQELRGRARQGPRHSTGQGIGSAGPHEAVSYRVTVACTRAQAEAIPDTGDLFPGSDAHPVLVADEPDASNPD